jgi:mannose-6-phosphate isomerase-like protein (cupin superfamily)
MTTTAIDLFTSFVRVDQDGRAYAEAKSFDREQTDWQLMTFHVRDNVDVHADQWEIHTEADEVVTCLNGGMRIYFRRDEPESDEEIVLAAGSAVIVPRGQWHRIELDSPSDLMSLTVPRGTHLEKRG